MIPIKEIVVNERFSSIVKSIETKGDEILTPLIRDKLVPSSKFLTNLADIVNNQTLTNVMLPPNCRYTENLPDGSSVIVMEEQPNFRTISSDVYMEDVFERLKILGQLEEYGIPDTWITDNRRPYSFTLSFPYIVYILNVIDGLWGGTMQIFFRLSPLTSVSDYLLKVPLYNINDSQTICLGDRLRSSNNLIESIQSAQEAFWLNTFNHDYNSNVRLYQSIPQVRDFLSWEHFSEVDPMFVFDVEWVNNERTLKKEIEYRFGGRRERNGTFNGLSFNLLVEAFKTQLPKSPIKRRADQVDSMYVNGAVISIGEEVVLEEKNYFINTFYCEDFSPPSKMEIEDPEGNKMVISITKEIKNDLINCISCWNNVEVILSNGVKIKKGDIVEVNYPRKSYKKVRRVRKARDGKIEVQLGDDIYLAENLVAKVLDIGDISYTNGRKFTPGEKVFLINTRDEMLPLCRVTQGTFIDIDVTQHGVPSFSFRAKHNDEDPHRTVHVTLKGEYECGDEVVENSDNIFISNTIRLGTKIFHTSEYDMSFYVIPGKAMGYYGYGKPWDYGWNRDAVIFNEEKDRIFIPGFDFNVDIGIGDQIMISDWTRPNEMMKVRTVVGFNEIGQEIHINSKYEDEPEISTQYITSNGHICVERIRKVVTELGGIKAGTKLRAKVPQVAGFPKKDVSQVVAFLIDTGGPPLILCSNYCTIWGVDDELENFEFYEEGTVSYNKWEVVVADPEKIKFQPGDMIRTYTNYIIMMNQNRALGLVEMDYLDTPSSIYGPPPRNLRSNQRIGFLGPRRTGVDLRERFQSHRCYPNLHGNYTIWPRSRMFMSENWEAIKNV